MNNYDYKKYAWIAGTFALAGIFLATLATGLAEFKKMDNPNGQQGTFSVSGEGEVTAIPDIATVSFTVRETGATVPDAQEAVEAKVKSAIDALAQFGVEEKDRKTTYYNVTPKYEYVSAGGFATNQKIVGYDVSQTFEVKIRKTDAAGDIIGALGAANITEISGPTFAIDDPEELQAEAKEKAIKQAREKADDTAKALGMRLGEIVQYSEDNGNYMPYARDVKAMGMGGGSALGSEVTLPTGENTVKVRVYITYTLE